jgi:hypothetical protein
MGQVGALFELSSRRIRREDVRGSDRRRSVGSVPDFWLQFTVFHYQLSLGCDRIRNTAVGHFVISIL